MGSERYKVVNLYDCNYLVDENSVVILQASRPPSVADMKGIAKRLNQLDGLWAAAEAALDVLEPSEDPQGRTSQVIAQLRAALHSQPEETK